MEFALLVLFLQNPAVVLIPLVCGVVYCSVQEYRKHKRRQYEEWAESQRETMEKEARSAWKTGSSARKSQTAYSRSSSSRIFLKEKPHAMYDKICSIETRSCNCTTSGAAQKCVDELYSIQTDLDINGDPENLKSYLASAIKEAEENLRNLKIEDWEEKADKVLSNFLDEFSYVTSDEDHSFGKVEDVLKSSKRCMKLWHDYWSIPFGDVYLGIDPHKYMERFLGNDFEPCMHSSDTLKKRLDAATEKLKPEHRRKMKIYRDILDYVNSQESIMRCDLLKHTFPNVTAKEAECCYRELVKQYRLVETKMGSRYFVSLSDKEKKKKDQS